MSERKRREFVLNWNETEGIYVVEPQNGRRLSLTINTVEVLPDDPSPEWTDELIRLCESEGLHLVKKIRDHLAKLGEK